jgi:hypothetical protein
MAAVGKEAERAELHKTIWRIATSEPFTDAELPLEPIAQPSARDHPPPGCTSATR